MSEELSLSYILLSQISQLFSLILSHPLYFSYFLFFSPYLFKVFSFLSPLFTTTFLLLIASFFTFSNSHQNQDDQSTSPIDQHIEWFNTLFNTPLEIPIIPFQLEDQEPEIKKEIDTSFSHVNKQEAKDGDDHNDHDIRENGIEMGVKNKSFLVGCKLVYEVDEEKMDLLWEKYEEKEKLVVDEKKDEKRCNNLKKDLRSLVNLQKEMEEEEEEEEVESGKICCLQALKISSGKMRFGMGKKSGLKKISKAFKGLKLLHQLASNGKNKTHS